MDINKQLKNYAKEDYQKFQERICPTKYPIMGINIPTLRKIAKNLLKQDSYLNILATLDNSSYETVMLKGLIIGELKIPYEEMLSLINSYLPLIDNWAICDIFASSLKFIKDHQEKFLNYLQDLLKEEKEYYLRFAITSLLTYYINDQYLDTVLNLLLSIKSDYYYVYMATSWAYSLCLIKYFKITTNFLIQNQNKIPQNTYNKALQKAIESHRLTPYEKKILKDLKR